MHLLMSEIQPVDSVLDRAFPWIDNLEDELTLGWGEAEALDDDEPLPGVRGHHWYELRLAALRQLIVGC